MSTDLAPATVLTVHEGDRVRIAKLRTADRKFDVTVSLKGDTMTATHIIAMDWPWAEGHTLALLEKAGVTVPEGTPYVFGGAL